MRNLVATLLILGATAAAVPVVSRAGIIRNRCCCHHCQRPCGTCNCAPSVQVPQTSYQPVIETQYVQQPTTTYRDVIETQYRTEAVNETVPQISYENVTVDEGAYQTVWVPRQVTRQVPRTSYQTRTSYRQVPYQVTRRVAEQTMQTIPTQAVRYVPRTTTASTCNTCGTPTGMISSGVPYTAAAAPYVQSAQLYGNYSSAPAPVISSTYPAYSPTPATAYSTGITPVPDPHFTAAAPTPVTPRISSVQEEDTFHSVTPASPETRTAAGGPSLFVPAPSAAQVWRTPRNTVIR